MSLPRLSLGSAGFRTVPHRTVVVASAGLGLDHGVANSKGQSYARRFDVQMERLANSQDQLKTDLVAELQADTQRQFDAINKRMDAANRQFEAMNQKIDATATALTTVGLWCFGVLLFLGDRILQIWAAFLQSDQAMPAASTWVPPLAQSTRGVAMIAAAAALVWLSWRWLKTQLFAWPQ